MKSGGPLGATSCSTSKDSAGSRYKREGFTVDRIEPSRTGDPALAVVWRVKPLTT